VLDVWIAAAASGRPHVIDASLRSAKTCHAPAFGQSGNWRSLNWRCRQRDLPKSVFSSSTFAFLSCQKIGGKR
jgi:hypothetical protein